MTIGPNLSRHMRTDTNPHSNPQTDARSTNHQLYTDTNPDSNPQTDALLTSRKVQHGKYFKPNVQFSRAVAAPGELAALPMKSAARATSRPPICLRTNNLTVHTFCALTRPPPQHTPDNERKRTKTPERRMGEKKHKHKDIADHDHFAN